MVQGLLDRLLGAAESGGEGDERRQRTLRALFLVLLVDVVGFGLVVPLLPFYAEEFGASPLTVGLLFAAFGAAQFVGVPLLE